MKLLDKTVISVAVATAAAFSFSTSAKAVTLTIGQNFTGSTFLAGSSATPPDTMGAIGPNEFVELINGRYSVYDKSTGTRVQTSTLNEFWQNAGLSSLNPLTLDPRVLYDHASGRWFASAIDLSPSSLANNNLLLAVSNSSDPTGGWKGFAFPGDSTKTQLADFPTLGVDANGVYLTADLVSITGTQFTFTGATINSIPKADILSSTPTISNRSSFEISDPNTYGFSRQPAVNFGSSDDGEALVGTQLQLSLSDVSEVLKLSNILNASTPSASLSSPVNISVSSYSDAPNATQPDGTTNLDTGDSRFRSFVYQVGNSLWAVHGINVDDRAAIRWYEIDKSTNAVLQSGTIGDPDRDYYYPSIAVNQFGNVVIGFSRSSLTEFVSSYAVVGDTVDGITTFGSPILLKPGVANYSQGNNRWGDYSATTVDPTDPLSFWTIQEFVSAPNTWSTQITELKITTVPEPSSALGTLAFGALGAVWMLKRKQKSANRDLSIDGTP